MASFMGMNALALTDYHSLTGAIEFYDSCKQQGITPIIGMEVNLALSSKLLSQSGVVSLLAMDLQGWISLCRLCSISAGEEPLPLETLAQHTAGLICLTGGVRGHLFRLIKAKQKDSIQSVLSGLKDLFPGRLYLELQIHSPDDVEICTSSATFAARNRLPTVATHDIHYLSQEQANLQKVLSAIRLNQTIDILSQESVAPASAYFNSEKQMEQSFVNFSPSLKRSTEIVERCCFELPLGIPRFPEIECPRLYQQMFTSKQKLGHRDYTDKHPRSYRVGVRTRLDKELGDLSECGYAFVIVEEILNYAREQGIPFSSRGLLLIACGPLSRCDFTRPDREKLIFRALSQSRPCYAS
jgi:DNA polymerase-3 subunit alpha